MLKPTKHATTNYRMLKPFLDAADARPEHHARFLSGGLMPLTVERLYYTHHGGRVYSITHYGEQNGDLMADPDMTLSVNHKTGTVDPLSFRNDYMGLYQEVYGENDAGREVYRPGLRTDLDRFLWQWLKNIQDQGFDPAVIDRSDDEDEDLSEVTEPAPIGEQIALFI